MKIFISTSTFGEDNNVFFLLKDKSITYKLNTLGRKLTEQEIKGALLSDNYVGLIAGTEPLTKDILDNSSLRVISRVGVGIDNIDLTSATSKGIKVYNTPDAVTEAVAELTVGFIFCALRKINILNIMMRNKIWEKKMGFLLRDKTVGIIGFGRIGRAVANKLKALGAKVMFFDKDENAVVGDSNFHKHSFDDILRQADIITLHADTKEQIIGKKEISAIRRGAIIINTARGNLIDEDALCAGLKSGKVSCACLDVFKEEPYSGPLTALDNTILTPHIGSYAREARIEMEKQAVENLIKGFKEEGLL